VDAKLEIEVPGIVAGAVRLCGLRVGPAPEELKKRIEEKCELMKASGLPDEPSRSAVRAMLRFGKYKPSGRGKPASEYLVESAREGAFPEINNAVDALNFVSMCFQLPISLLDTEKAGSLSFRLRRGREGESYVFNRSGQTLELQDLLLVSVLPSDEPLGTPVKDCQRTKVDERTAGALAIIYAPSDMRETLAGASEALCREMGAFSRAEAAIFTS